MALRPWNRSAVVAALAAAALVFTSAAPAVAATNPKDTSEAMRYGASSPLGSVITALSGADDDTYTVAAPWPLNFFGVKYEGLCITTNGGVFPVPTATDGCSDSYDYDLAYLAGSANAPMIAVMATDIDLDECAGTERAASKLAGTDGFGVPCEMYLDTAATIDGRDAVVITWYRTSNNDDVNDPALENTFQLALIKLPTTNGASAGYDFDLEFNYGTVMDYDDGYSAEDGTSSCTSEAEGSPECRWGIGVASYDAGTDTGTGYEFFAASIARDMMDDGATPLVRNSLGTTVQGRYTCGMVAGQAVGCDPVTMTSGEEQGEEQQQEAAPELAETGFDESFTAVGFVGLLLAATFIAAGALLARRTSASTAARD